MPQTDSSRALRNQGREVCGLGPWPWALTIPRGRFPVGRFLGGVHDSTSILLCPFHIWLPLPSASGEAMTNPRQEA